jgi:Beta-ketoacyl synthase, N-terminal domain
MRWMIGYVVLIVVNKVTYEALESAGISKERIKGTKTGVFIGHCGSDYQIIQTTEHEDIKQYTQVCYEVLVLNTFCYSFTHPDRVFWQHCSKQVVVFL